MIASLTNSMLSKFDLNLSHNTDYSISGTSNNNININNTSMSLSKSDLFSSMKDDDYYKKSFLNRDYSNDSLNTGMKQSLLFMSTNSLSDDQKNYLYTCRANKNNYTIAFEENDALFSSIERNFNLNLHLKNNTDKKFMTWHQLNHKSKKNLNRTTSINFQTFQCQSNIKKSFSLSNVDEMV